MSQSCLEASLRSSLDLFRFRDDNNGNTDCPGVGGENGEGNGGLGSVVRGEKGIAEGRVTRHAVDNVRRDQVAGV